MVESEELTHEQKPDCDELFAEQRSPETGHDHGHKLDYEVCCLQDEEDVCTLGDVGKQEVVEVVASLVV